MITIDEFKETNAVTLKKSEEPVGTGTVLKPVEEGKTEVVAVEGVPVATEIDETSKLELELEDILSEYEKVETDFFGDKYNTHSPLLYIKSFIDPGEEGTVITDGVDMIPLVPSFISKREQILVSFTPRDFSFIGEKELSEIFKVLSDHNIAVNLMQNSAISFSVVFNQVHQDLENIRQSLELKFSIRFNKGLELLTIRHYNEHIIKELTTGKNLLLEQRSRNTVRLIMDT